MRRTDKRMILMALDIAIRSEQDLIDGLPDDDPIVVDSEGNIDAMRRVIERMTGGKLTMTELYNRDVLDKMPTVGLGDLQRMAEAGEIPVHKFGDALNS